MKQEPTDERVSGSSCPECEEESFCNCEGVERLTPYQREDCECGKQQEKIEKSDRAIERAMKKLYATVKRSFGRRSESRECKKCVGDTQIKHRMVCDAEIYEGADDTAPTNRIRMEHICETSLRALLVAGGAVVSILVFCKCFGKRN